MLASRQKLAKNVRKKDALFKASIGSLGSAGTLPGEAQMVFLTLRSVQPRQELQAFAFLLRMGKGTKPMRVRDCLLVRSVAGKSILLCIEKKKSRGVMQSAALVV